jgi:uncharacterized membrane protein YgaE (UPF0421/DUF939 family)
MTQIPNCNHHQTYGTYKKCQEKYLKEFKEKSFFFDARLEGLVKHFLDEFLELDIWQSDYRDIRSNYENIFEDTTSPQNPREFYSYIAKEYLELESSPKEKLYELYRKVSQDLKGIAYTIEKLQSKLQELEKKKKELGFLDVEDRYRRNHISYYIKKNEDAMSTIVEYLREDIFEDAYLESCVNNGLGGLASIRGIKSYPYYVLRQSFFRFTNIYDIDDFSDLHNKMEYLPVQEHKKVQELYRDKKFEELLHVMSDYLQQYKIVETIKELLDRNHILNSRKKIFETIFRHLENSDYISVNNMLPLQIEGLFHDYCSLIGIGEKELNISSLNDKLDKLQEQNENGLRSNYEYFSFRFPVIRNRVAHGRYFKSDDKLQAYFLIFDLFTVCEMITNPKIDLNRLVGFLRDEIDFERIFEIIRFKDFNLPYFYEQERKVFQNVKEKIKDDGFKEFLKEKILSEDELGLKVFKKDIGYIKKYFIDKDNKLLQTEFAGMFGLINGRLVNAIT